MYATLEIGEEDVLNKGDDSVIKIDSNIQSLSWMSKWSCSLNNTNSKFSQDEAKYQKFLYYQVRRSLVIVLVLDLHLVY